MSPCRMKFRPTASLHDCDNGSLPRAPYRDRISGQPVARTLHPLDGIVTATATTGARPAAPHAPAKPAAQPSAFPRLAAIDIGTNSIRLVVAEVQPDGTYRVLDEDREMTRLGRGLYRDGRLGDAPMQQSLQALGRMKAIADGFGVAELRAIATAAVREAANGRDFVSEAWRRHRVRLEVVPAEEEARLAFRSVTRHYDLADQLTAIVDIGGGSTEVILAAGGLVEQVVSLPLGAVRLAERYCKSDPLKEKHWKALRRAIDQTIEDGIGKPPFAADVMIGSGGTFTNLAEMAQAERDGKVTGARDYQLSRAEAPRRCRHPPGRRAVARHRLSDQSRAAPQARVPPDPARRPARLLGPRDRADRQRRALSPPRLPQGVAHQLRPPRPRGAPPGPAARRDPARGRRSRSDTRPGDHPRPLPDGRRLGPGPRGRRPRSSDRAGRR